MLNFMTLRHRTSGTTTLHSRPLDTEAELSVIKKSAGGALARKMIAMKAFRLMLTGRRSFGREFD